MNVVVHRGIVENFNLKALNLKRVVGDLFKNMYLNPPVDFPIMRDLNSN